MHLEVKCLMISFAKFDSLKDLHLNPFYLSEFVHFNENPLVVVPVPSFTGMFHNYIVLKIRKYKLWAF